MDTLAVSLKTETAFLHQQTEDLLLPKLAAIRSAADYAAVLSAFYGFFEPLQQQLSRFIDPEQLPDLAQRRHAGLILLDLCSLGVDAVPPLCSRLPVLQGSAAAWGALYVMEGSTLGGRMISKMLQKNSAFPLGNEALHFFNGYGEQTGTMWKTFLAALNQQQDAAAVTAAANDTFLHLKLWLNDCLYAATDTKK